MTLAANSADFHRRPAFSAAPTAAVTRPSLLRRMFDALMLSRKRQTERELDRLVSWRDGNFTDSLEREIAERSYDDGWNFRR